MSMKAVSLKCSSCGAGLSIPPDIDRLACGFCGTAQLVERAGGIIALKPLTDAIVKVQVGTDKTAAELALHRLTQEWHQAIQNRQYAISYWQRALAHAGSSAINTSMIVALIVGVGGSILGFAVISNALAASGMSRAVAGGIGAMVSVVAAGLAAVYIFIQGQKTARKEEAQVAVKQAAAMKEIDDHLAKLGQQIDKNRQIVNS
jgi:ribosomal protein S27AE